MGRIAAHFRSRGENKSLVRPLLTGPGSSPLTRGKLGGLHGLGGRGRLIPAHAGKTPPPRHTHSPDPGSSPLTQGKPVDGAGHVRLGRLIPAHAGKTAPRCPPWGPTGAHPRSRGENEAARQPHGWETGSSPLTRGKQHKCSARQLVAGLIPAHAGKTSRQ